MFVPGKPFQPRVMFLVRPEPTQVELLSSAPLLALSTNITVSLKDLSGTNPLLPTYKRTKKAKQVIANMALEY
jgi:hypothetical protein